MQASLLNEIVEIYVPRMTRNEFHEQIQTYELLYKTRAKVNHNSGSKLMENDAIVVNYKKQFTVRIYHNLNENMRIKYDGDFYRILSIEKNPQYQQIDIVTEKVNNEDEQ